MDALRVPLPEPRELLKLARSSRKQATDAIAALSLEEQAELVCSTPLEVRERMLQLTPLPEEVIPLLPEAEFCFTAKAIGLGDASWILEHATATQLVASLDLDAWDGLLPDPTTRREWMTALAEAGDEPLLLAAQSLDPEFVVLMLRDRAHVMLDPKDDDWQAPEGAITLEGQFYLLAHDPGDDLTDLLQMLHVLFREDYWLYFRMMQGVIWELESDLQEWALSWRVARLEDLGFPRWEEAMRIYGYVRPEERGRIPKPVDALNVREWHLPVFLPELPAELTQGHSLFRAAAELNDDERRGFFYAFVAIANKLAVADRKPLGDATTLPETIETAAEVLSTALEYLASENAMAAPDVLRGVPLERLFRVGAGLKERLPPPLVDPDANESDEDPEEL